MSVKVMKAVMANNSRLAETNRATLGKAIGVGENTPLGCCELVGSHMASIAILAALYDPFGFHGF